MHPKCVIDKWQLFDNIGYKPHEGQRAFHESDAKNRTMACGWGWGKSTALAREIEPLLLSPKTITWLVAPDYGEASKEFGIVYDDLVNKLHLPLEEAFFNVGQGRMSIVTPRSCGGSVLAVKSERNPASLEAEDVDHMVYVEAGQLKRRTYERCQGRLRMGGYQMTGFTPEGFNWAFDELWEPAQRKERDWWARRGPSNENPALDPDWLEVMKTRLSPQMYEAKIEGRFRTHTGHVFADFDPGVHVRHLTRLDGYPLYAGVDYGYTNPTVVLDIQVNTKDQVLVLAEYYETQRTATEHAEIVKAWGKDYRLMLTDPAGADENETWTRAGLKVQGVTREIALGNELIISALKVREDGEPGLLIDESCVHLIDEFTKYRWGPTRENAEAKENPLKADDHTAEALSRFMCWHAGMKRVSDAKPKAYGTRQFGGQRMPRST